MYWMVATILPVFVETLEQVDVDVVFLTWAAAS